MRNLIFTAAIVLLCPAACAFGQRAPFPIPDPDPEIERKSFIVAEGFEVNLFASELTPTTTLKEGGKEVASLGLPSRSR